MPTRKQNAIKTKLQSINVVLVLALLIITFAFANLYTARCELDAMDEIAASYGFEIDFPSDTKGFVILLLASSVISTLLLELYMSVYYYFGFRYMRGLMPFSQKEFKDNLRPFMVVRNLIWGLLSLLAFSEGGYFITLSVFFFETLANMIIFFPFYFYMKKHYIADNVGGSVLLSFAIPFLVFDVLGVFLSMV